MANAKPKYKGAKFTTPVGRLSFPAIMTPKLKYQSKTDFEYSTDLLWEEGTDLSDYKKAIAEALTEVFGPKDKWPKQRLNLPLNDQIVLIEKAEEKGHGIDHLQAGAFYARFKTNAKNGKPVVVDKNRKEITDESAVYGGVYARVSGTMKVNQIEGSENYTDEKGVNRQRKIVTTYVTAYLAGVQITKDGEAFGGGRRSAEDMFDAAAFGDEQTVDAVGGIDDLM